MSTTYLAGLALFLVQALSAMQSVGGASAQGPRVEPWERPDILGKIEEIIEGSSGSGPDTGTILVQAQRPHRAYIMIDDKTILAEYRQKLSFADLKVGQQVAVWFRAGLRYPVFPLRTSAARIAVIEASFEGGIAEEFPWVGAIRVGGNVQARKLIHGVEPVYPPEARRKGVQGSVILQVIVDEEGQGEEARVIRGSALLDQAAVDAVRQWRYRPTFLKGNPVPVIATVVVNFRLFSD